MKQNKQKKNTFLLVLAMLMLSIISATIVMGTKQPLAIACCESNQTTGICDPANPKFLNYGESCVEGVWSCEQFASLLFNQGITDSTRPLLMVSMGNTEIIDTSCLVEPSEPLFSKVIGRIKSSTNNATHMQTESIKTSSGSKCVLAYGGETGQIGSSNNYKCNLQEYDINYCCSYCINTATEYIIGAESSSCLTDDFDIVDTNILRKNTSTKDMGHQIVYDTPQPIAYSELNFTYDLQNVTYWNGTANVTEERNISYVNIFFEAGYTNLSVDVSNVPTANAPATITFETGMIGATPVIQRDGIQCNSECEDITFNHTTGTLTFDVQNFSSYSTSANSNVFVIHEPTSSCTSNVSNVFFYGCSGRFGQAIDKPDAFSCSQLLNYMINYGYATPTNVKVVMSGSNEWYDRITSCQEVMDILLNCESGICQNEVLGRLKGTASHNALMSGNTTTSLMIDSPDATIEYDATSETNMSQILDMSIDTLIANDPFQLAEGLIMADSENYPTLDKKAKITFKNVESGTTTILKDGEPCPNDVCTETTYNNQEQTLSTEVTGFSTYTLATAYTEEDVSPALFDITGKVIVGFGSLAGLFGVFIALIVTMLIIKVFGKK